ncbi:MAG TPA: sialidase family protein [Balneolaceae bacterium]|nr:sialidase family protein [Balneolaceae bacterium]
MKTLFPFITALILLSGCSASHIQKTETHVLEAAGKTANYPEMTQDHQGNIIAWWVETNPETGEEMVYFSRSPLPELSFKESRPIPTSRDANVGAGHIPELVIKPNGTYVLVFARLNKASDARFAGNVFYTQSFDQGKTWTKAKPIPDDPNPDNSHSFPDAILLPDGEVGAVWLDGRHHTVHSEIYFAKTEGKKGFGPDKKIGGPGCQCCKLDLYVDENQNVHLVYRSLTENNIRDIKHIISADNGQSFSAPTLVSDDNWQIGACPHNGPSVTKTDDGLYVVWYTQGGDEGLYYAVSDDNGQTFTPRQKLTEQGNHAYLVTLGESVMVIWDEIYRDENKFYNRVKMSLISKGEVVESRYLSPKGVEAMLPFLLELENGNIMAIWVQQNEEGNELRFQKFGGRE